MFLLSMVSLRLLCSLAMDCLAPPLLFCMKAWSNSLFMPLFCGAAPRDGGADQSSTMLDETPNPFALSKYSIVAPRRFGQFYLNDSLSDFTLIDCDTGKRHNVHRVVLASASGLIHRF